MSAAAVRRSREELARLSAEWYDRRVRPTIRPEDESKFVSIDVETGEYEMHEDDYTAVTRLRARVPTADGCLMRGDGSPAHRFGFIR